MCHCKRVCYVTTIVKRALETAPAISDPHDGYGWILQGNDLQIQWMLLPPAPPQILELISCGCKKGCVTRSCSCVVHGFSCSDVCTFARIAKMNREVNVLTNHVMKNLMMARRRKKKMTMILEKINYKKMNLTCVENGFAHCLI